MKAVALSVTLLVISLFIGCSDQSMVNNPAPTSGISTAPLAKLQDVIKVDTKVIGPGGNKYVIVGAIGHSFRTGGITMTLTTDVSLKIVQVGTGAEEKVAGQGIHSFSQEPVKGDVVSESYAIGSVAESSLRVWIEYVISDDGINLNDIRIVINDLD